MQAEEKMVVSGQDDFEVRPEVRVFTPKAASPCLQEARQHVASDSVIAWVGNCGCTCLCPNPPS